MDISNITNRLLRRYFKCSRFNNHNEMTPPETPTLPRPILIACDRAKFMSTAVRLEAVTHIHKHTRAAHTHMQL